MHLRNKSATPLFYSSISKSRKLWLLLRYVFFVVVVIAVVLFVCLFSQKGVNPVACGREKNAPLPASDLLKSWRMRLCYSHIPNVGLQGWWKCWKQWRQPSSARALQREWDKRYTEHRHEGKHTLLPHQDCKEKYKLSYKWKQLLSKGHSTSSQKTQAVAIPIPHLTANCSSFVTTLTAQKWCVISRLNLSNFKFQPLGFIMLLSASLKSCHWCFSASIIFQCVIPDPFPSYAWTVLHPYLEIS